jgi:hypothetical protein
MLDSRFRAGIEDIADITDIAKREGGHSGMAMGRFVRGVSTEPPSQIALSLRLFAFGKVMSKRRTTLTMTRIYFIIQNK